MSDWRQIQARIRKAKAAVDPAGQLAGLYERTRDAMVAFELARHHEKRGENQDAARWYTAAAERFRRAQWKVKAQEALTRLGVPISSSEAEAHAPLEETHQDLSLSQQAFHTPISNQENEPAPQAVPIVAPISDASTTTSEPVQPGAEGDAGRRRRRRGRRGGRGRRRGKNDLAAAGTVQPGGRPTDFSAPLAVPAPPLPPVRMERPILEPPARVISEPSEPAIEHAAEPFLAPVRGRAGD